jgi:hypothetical protein
LFQEDNEEAEENDGPSTSRENVDEDIIEVPVIPEKRPRRQQMGNSNASNSFAGMRGTDGQGGGAWASDKIKNMMKVVYFRVFKS